jgi:hypothetical protein
MQVSVDAFICPGLPRTSPAVVLAVVITTVMLAHDNRMKKLRRVGYNP